MNNGLGQPLIGCRKTLNHIPGTKAEMGNHEYAANSVIIITNQFTIPSLSKVIQLHIIFLILKNFHIVPKKKSLQTIMWLNKRQKYFLTQAAVENDMREEVTIHSALCRTVVNQAATYSRWHGQTHTCSNGKVRWGEEESDMGQFGGCIVTKHTFLASWITGCFRTLI